MRFQVYFTPLPGSFSPFPHGTSSLSVSGEYLALEDGPPMFKQDFTCPVLLEITTLVFRVPGFHRLWPAFPGRSTRVRAASGLLPVRSPLLGESRLISFPPATEMFQFAGFAFGSYGFRPEWPYRAGFPHSDIPGSKLVCQLPEAYRRLPRPSSPSAA